MPGSTPAGSEQAATTVTKPAESVVTSARESATTSPSGQASRRAGHSPSGRLVAQRGLFVGPSPVCPEDLYVRILRGAAARDRQRLAVQPFSKATMDTYFGRFPASYWQRWTVAKEVVIELTVTGSGQVAVVASDPDGESRVVDGQRVRDTKRSELSFTVPLDKFVDGGFLWLDVTTEDAELAVEGVRWTVAAPQQLRRSSVVICTYNRADDCIATLRALAGEADALDVLDAVYVVDQGNDAVSSRPAFPEIEKALGGRLRYLRQPNLGGAGGFGRGLYEISGRSEPANALLMDDDVLCDPEIAIRMTAFANRTVHPTIVGGQMLRLLHPTRLIASAEYASFALLKPGRVVNGALDDVDLLTPDRKTGRLPRGDARADADYNAWWACLIPSEVVAELGYPMPLFFQWDDVEYGYRARKRGFNTVTLPGAGLWHADFDWKDADKWNEYFAVRNSLIVSALHANVDPRQTAKVLAGRIARYLLTMQYGLAMTITKAAEDYLDGPSILTDGGASAAAEIRKLRAEYPDTIMHPASDVPGLRTNRVPIVPSPPAPSRNKLVLLKRAAHLLRGKAPHQLGWITKSSTSWWHVSQFRTAVVTDGSQEGVRLRRRDRDLAVKLGKRAGRMLRRLVAETPALREQYRAALPELTTRENWQRLYQL